MFMACVETIPVYFTLIVLVPFKKIITATKRLCFTGSWVFVIYTPRAMS